VQHFASDAAAKAKELTSAAGEKVKDVAAQVPQTIRRYPVESLLAGVGSVFLAALIINKMR